MGTSDSQPCNQWQGDKWHLKQGGLGAAQGGPRLPKWLSGKKNLPAMQEMQETWVQSLGWEEPLEKEMEAHSTILAGESHGQKSLVGYSP